MDKKICARALERFLEGVYIFGDKKEFNMVFYSSDTDLIGGRNHKTYGNYDKEVIKREYKKHIPECDECAEVYVGYLYEIKKDNESIMDADKRSLNAFYSRNRNIPIKKPTN